MKKYGLIGKKLTYSYSLIIHNYLLKHHNISASYDLVEVDSISYELLNSYDGLNITIPFKEEVKQYLNNKLVLPCNTIKKNNNKLFGFNTDQYGFKYLLKNSEDLTINKVVILGSGASAKMIQSLLPNKDIIVISRNDSYYNYDNITEFDGDLLINTTPIGMSEYLSPLPETCLKKYQAVIDLNYNPLNSKLALDCKKIGLNFINGLDMLIIQAIKSFEIWHDIKVAYTLKKAIYQEVLKRSQKKIALIGLSLSGKTTIVKKFNGLDLDEEISLHYQESIATMIENNTFRKREQDTLKKLVNNDVRLLACGGGIVLDHENMIILKDYLIIYLKSDYQSLAARLNKEKRPLLQNEKQLKQMVKDRTFLYERYANLTLTSQELEVFLSEISYS
ncbi:hypothetical protein LJB88_02860 [Erysipelotrichaceae bacterium OttesenSCG-928-M19]|nr:hypothetical protein [Erysipelotrichaceae bacterium OttesenSCG-928-M19]